jgi:hypothetical protein
MGLFDSIRDLLGGGSDLVGSATSALGDLSGTAGDLLGGGSDLVGSATSASPSPAPPMGSPASARPSPGRSPTLLAVWAKRAPRSATSPAEPAT